MAISKLQSGIVSNEFFKIINENFKILEESSRYTSLSTSNINDEAITTKKIANKAITRDKLAANAVTTDKIANSNVTGEKVQDGSITLDKLDPTLRNTINMTKRIFIVSSIPSGTTIIDINNNTFEAEVGDILIKVTGLNG